MGINKGLAQNQQQSNQAVDIYWVPTQEKELSFNSVGAMNVLNPEETKIKKR